MTSLKWYCCALFALGLGVSVSAAPAGKAADKPAPAVRPAAKAADKAADKAPADRPKSELKGEYLIMANELKLSDEQRSKLTEKVRARATALDAWTKENGDKLEAARKASDEAKKGTDKDAQKKAQAGVRELEDAREKALASFHTEILALLTPEQKAQWAGFNLYRGSVAGHYKKVHLTGEQVAKAKALSAEAAKELEGKADDRKARAAVLEQLYKKIDETVLTEEQRKTMVPTAPTTKQDNPK